MSPQVRNVGAIPSRVRLLFACTLIWIGDFASAQDSHPAQKPSNAAASAVTVPGTRAAENPAQRLRREGIRAMSSSNSSPCQPECEPARMAAAGLNLVLPWAAGSSLLAGARKTSAPESPTILHPEDVAEESVARLRDWALCCKKNDIVLMYVVLVAAENEVRYLTGHEPTADGHLLNYVGFEKRDLLKSRVKKIWPSHQYRHVVDWDGSEARWAPCPLERRYWMGLIRPELKVVARVLKEAGTGGGACLELETYCFYSIYPGMASQKKTFCYCDECFYGFVRSLGQSDAPDAVPPDHRFDWLTLRGLLGRYEQSLEDRLAAIIQEMIEDVRKENPGFLLGFYPYAPHWYYDALVRGGGTPELPCLLFSSAEYHGGYTSDPPSTFNGDMPTPASLAHLKRRGLRALYAGGLYDKGIGSPEAYVLAMDRLLRAANGYWAYHELPKSEYEPFWKHLPEVNRWNRAHPDPLPTGSLQDILPAAIEHIGRQKRPGLTVEHGQVVARYQADINQKSLLVSQAFEDEQELQRSWRGRGALPSLDRTVFHSGKASLRFEPSAAGNAPRSPFLDQIVPVASEVPCEISFWVKTDATAPVRLWVGTATTDQYPGYMWYHNFVLPACQDWTRIRLAPLVNPGMLPRLDVIRFWCQPTDGRLWLDDFQLRAVQERVIDVPLALPAEASGWGTVEWLLSPSDAYVQAEVIAARQDHVLQRRLHSGDSLAPLAAVMGREPVRLRLRVYPSAQESVVLREVKLGTIPQEHP